MAWPALAHIGRLTTYRNVTCILGAGEIRHLPKPMVFMSIIDKTTTPLLTTVEHKYCVAAFIPGGFSFFQR
jgi:hypothetical protein